MTRLLLVSGKGGVGKTTVAAASAVRAAELGHRTLLVSVDRAHNVGDVLGLRLSGEPREVAPGLDAFEADPQVELRRHWDIFHLVSAAEPIVIQETLSAFGLFSLHGLCVDSVVLDRLLPGPASRGFFAPWARAQERERARARELSADVPLLELAWQTDEVIGIPALARAAQELYGQRDPAASLVSKPPMRFAESRAGTTLEISLKQADAHALDLKQRGDDLIVTAAGWRRHLSLPESLRGRAVSTAHLRGGVLRITFAPRGRKEAS